MAALLRRPGDLDAPSSVEQQWQLAHEFVVQQLGRGDAGLMQKSEEEEAALQRAAAQGPEDHNKVCMGLAYAILTQGKERKSAESHGRERWKKLLIRVTRDGHKAVVDSLSRLVETLYPKLSSSARVQLMWLTEQLVSLGVECSKLVFMLWRTTLKGDASDLNLWLVKSCAEMLSAHLGWLDSRPRMVEVALYNAARLSVDLWRVVRDQDGLVVESARRGRGMDKQQVLTCLAQLSKALAGRFPHVWPNGGRDLLRLLRLLRDHPIFASAFGSLWVDVESGDSLSDAGLNLLDVQTPCELLRSCLSPELERDIMFVLNHVQFGEQQRYEQWLRDRFFPRTSHTTICSDLIRFVCRAFHPSNKLIRSSVTPRWALTGYFLNSCTDVFARDMAHDALLCDLLYFQSSQSVMDIEPVVLLQYRSLTKHRSVTVKMMKRVADRLEGMGNRERLLAVKAVTSGYLKAARVHVVRNIAPILSEQYLSRDLAFRLQQYLPDLYSQSGVVVSSGSASSSAGDRHDSKTLDRVQIRNRPHHTSRGEKRQREALGVPVAAEEQKKSQKNQPSRTKLKRPRTSLFRQKPGGSKGTQPRAPAANPEDGESSRRWKEADDVMHAEVDWEATLRRGLENTWGPKASMTLSSASEEARGLYAKVSGCNNVSEVMSGALHRCFFESGALRGEGEYRLRFATVLLVCREFLPLGVCKTFPPVLGSLLLWVLNRVADGRQQENGQDIAIQDAWRSAFLHESDAMHEVRMWCLIAAMCGTRQKPWAGIRPPGRDKLKDEGLLTQPLLSGAAGLPVYDCWNKLLGLYFEAAGWKGAMMVPMSEDTGADGTSGRTARDLVQSGGQPMLQRCAGKVGSDCQRMMFSLPFSGQLLCLHVLRASDAMRRRTKEERRFPLVSAMEEVCASPLVLLLCVDQLKPTLRQSALEQSFSLGEDAFSGVRQTILTMRRLVAASTVVDRADYKTAAVSSGTTVAVWSFYVDRCMQCLSSPSDRRRVIRRQIEIVVDHLGECQEADDEDDVDVGSWPAEFIAALLKSNVLWEDTVVESKGGSAASSESCVLVAGFFALSKLSRRVRPPLDILQILSIRLGVTVNDSESHDEPLQLLSPFSHRLVEVVKLCGSNVADFSDVWRDVFSKGKEIEWQVRCLDVVHEVFLLLEEARGSTAFYTLANDDVVRELKKVDRIRSEKLHGFGGSLPALSATPRKPPSPTTNPLKMSTASLSGFASLADGRLEAPTPILDDTKMKDVADNVVGDSSLSAATGLSVRRKVNHLLLGIPAESKAKARQVVDDPSPKNEVRAAVDVGDEDGQPWQSAVASRDSSDSEQSDDAVPLAELASEKGTGQDKFHEEDSPVYFPKTLHDVKGVGDDLKFKVEWVDWPNERDFTWEPLDHLRENLDLIDVFFEEHKLQAWRWHKATLYAERSAQGTSMSIAKPNVPSPARRSPPKLMLNSVVEPESEASTARNEVGERKKKRRRRQQAPGSVLRQLRRTL